MKRTLIILFLLAVVSVLRAQQVDSLYFNLYTDSLKKGVYNYINVEAKLQNGQWLPLTTKEIKFEASAGRFEGNSLILDTAFTGSFIRVKAILLRDPRISREIQIPIKKFIPDSVLKKPEEVMKSGKRG